MALRTAIASGCLVRLLLLCLRTPSVHRLQLDPDTCELLAGLRVRLQDQPHDDQDNARNEEENRLVAARLGNAPDNSSCQEKGTHHCRDHDSGFLQVVEGSRDGGSSREKP
jgi:hypothetical protein